MHKSVLHVISLGLVLLMALALNPGTASAEKVLNVSSRGTRNPKEKTRGKCGCKGARML